MGPITSSSSPHVDDKMNAALFKSTDIFAPDAFNTFFFLLRRPGDVGVLGISCDVLQMDFLQSIGIVEEAQHTYFSISCTDCS